MVEAGIGAARENCAMHLTHSLVFIGILSTTGPTDGEALIEYVASVSVLRC